MGNTSVITDQSRAARLADRAASTRMDRLASSWRGHSTDAHAKGETFTLLSPVTGDTAPREVWTLSDGETITIEASARLTSAQLDRIATRILADDDPDGGWDDPRHVIYGSEQKELVTNCDPVIPANDPNAVGLVWADADRTELLCWDGIEQTVVNVVEEGFPLGDFASVPSAAHATLNRPRRFSTRRTAGGHEQRRDTEPAYIRLPDEQGTRTNGRRTDRTERVGTFTVLSVPAYDGDGRVRYQGAERLGSGTTGYSSGRWVERGLKARDAERAAKRAAKQRELEQRAGGRVDRTVLPVRAADAARALAMGDDPAVLLTTEGDKLTVTARKGGTLRVSFKPAGGKSVRKDTTPRRIVDVVGALIG